MTLFDRGFIWKTGFFSNDNQLNSLCTMSLTVLTVDAVKSRLTSTSVPIQSTVTGSTILTGIAATIIYFCNVAIYDIKKILQNFSGKCFCEYSINITFKNWNNKFLEIRYFFDFNLKRQVILVFSSSFCILTRTLEQAERKRVNKRIVINLASVWLRMKTHGFGSLLLDHILHYNCKYSL